jgi:hypothetical protein
MRACLREALWRSKAGMPYFGTQACLTGRAGNIHLNLTFLWGCLADGHFIDKLFDFIYYLTDL